MYHSFDLEATILDILYQKCLDRPLWVSESEVYWLIPHLSVTEREVREVLEQLVFHRRVLKQVGKYQISKAEFQSIKERIECHETQISEEKMTTQALHQGKETQGDEQIIKSSLRFSRQRIWRIGLIVCCGLLTIGFVSLLYNVVNIGNFSVGNSTAVHLQGAEGSKPPLMEDAGKESHKVFSQNSVYRTPSQPANKISTDSLIVAMQKEQVQLALQIQVQAKQVRYLSYWLIVILGMLLCTALGLLRISSRYFFKKQE